MCVGKPSPLGLASTRLGATDRIPKSFRVFPEVFDFLGTLNPLPSDGAQRGNIKIFVVGQKLPKIAFVRKKNNICTSEYIFSIYENKINRKSHI